MGKEKNRIREEDGIGCMREEDGMRGWDRVHERGTIHFLSFFFDFFSVQLRMVKFHIG